MAPKKGRSFELVSERNRALIIRYWYWSEIWQRRHASVLDTLQHQEFFLMPGRVEVILRNDNGYYNQLCGIRPTCKELAKMLPAFRFDENSHFGKENNSQPKLF